MLSLRRAEGEAMRQSVLYFVAAGLFWLATLVNLIGFGIPSATTWLGIAAGAAFLWLGLKERRLGH